MPCRTKEEDDKDEKMGLDSEAAGVRLGHIFYLFLLISSQFLVATGFQKKKIDGEKGKA
jgi:hypothetical protein